MRPLDPILEKLSCAQTAFLSGGGLCFSGAVENKAESRGMVWSAAELVAHLVTVERAIIGGADRITQKIPKAIPFLKRFHFPMWLVEGRIIRRKSPIPLDPSLLNTKEEMLGELRAARERTLAFLEETSKRDWSTYCWPHPFLGMLNGYEWFELIASHEIRHTKQMRGIIARLPKAVESA
jgi:hypothetical protein